MLAGGPLRPGPAPRMATRTDRVWPTSAGRSWAPRCRIFALLMYYLAEYRGAAGAGRQDGETRHHWPSDLASGYGIQVYEVPVGFKVHRPKMIETGAMMGGEESGGFGFGMHLPERDGIFTDLMLLDLFLRERDVGRWPASRRSPISTRSRGHRATAAWNVHFDQAVYPALKDRLLVELPQKAPTELAGRPVVRTQTLSTNDGFQVLRRRRIVVAGPVQRVPSPSCGSTRKPHHPPQSTRIWRAGEAIVRGA